MAKCWPSRPTRTKPPPSCAGSPDATHEVRTAIALAIQGPLLNATSVSTVTFRELDDEEIKRYCATSEPYDKAGGYGIQGLAAVFVERIEGSYTGVMGLPLFETARLLQQAGIRVL